MGIGQKNGYQPGMNAEIVQDRRASLPLVVVGLAGFVGVLAYCDFPVQWLVNSHLSPLRSYVSELAVAGQPARSFFRLSDIVAGVGLIAVANLLMRWQPTKPASVAHLSAMVAGISSMVDGLWPMPCAPSIDLSCRATEEAIHTAQVVQPHTASSLIGFSALLCAIGLYGAVLIRNPGYRGLGASGLSTAAAAAFLGGVDIAMCLTASTALVGLVERIQVTVIAAWLAVLILCVARDQAVT
ncbi:DUF998 domain-containing protein [Mycobacterium sp. CBMA226]|nr:DUF998 domain-containing protein [Mycolicibacterium sp. CBMA 226]